MIPPISGILVSGARDIELQHDCYSTSLLITNDIDSDVTVCLLRMVDSENDFLPIHIIPKNVLIKAGESYHIKERINFPKGQTLQLKTTGQVCYDFNFTEA